MLLLRNLQNYGFIFTGDVKKYFLVNNHFIKTYDYCEAQKQNQSLIYNVFQKDMKPNIVTNNNRLNTYSK